MRGNRRRDTGPELALRRALHKRGLRYRVELPLRPSSGRVIRPDVCFTRARVAVFVDGCFWHGCPQHGTKPRTNADYWGAKIARNVERDAVQTAALEAVGWSVVRVWEHEASEPAAARVAAIVTARQPPQARASRARGRRT